VHRTHPAFPQGFDEYMNLVLDKTDELDMKKKTRKSLGKILLKGENVVSIHLCPT
jgi:small nuclear ribonucleoprotein (snRNP)-like protein